MFDYFGTKLFQKAPKFTIQPAHYFGRPGSSQQVTRTATTLH